MQEKNNTCSVGPRCPVHPLRHACACALFCLLFERLCLVLMFFLFGWEAAVKGKFVRMYIEYLLPAVRILLKSSLSCILRSVRELCTTPDKIIKPQSVLTSTRSMKNCYAVVSRWPYAMYQIDLTSHAALWLLYETNLLSFYFLFFKKPTSYYHTTYPAERTS